jgi:hypothetical protein
MRDVIEFLGQFSVIIKFLSSAITLYVALAKLSKLWRKRKMIQSNRFSER